MFKSVPTAAMALMMILTAVSVFAEEGGPGALTLEAAVNEAIGQSPNLSLAHAREDQAAGKKLESLSGFLPTVGAQAYHLTNTKYESFATNIGGQDLTIPFVTPKTSFKVSFALPIFDGLRNVNDYRSSVASSDAGAEASAWEEFLLSQTVRNSFYRAIAAELLAEVANENIKTLEDHYSHVQARKKGGIATAYDVLRVEVQLDQARTQKIQADDDVAIERNHLAVVMGSPADVRALKGELPIPNDSAKLPNFRAEDALQRRKDLHALQLEAKASDLSSASAHAWIVPSIGLMANYEIYNNSSYDIDRSDPYHNAYDVGIYLKWNLFDGGASLGRAAQSTALRKQSDAKLQIESQHLPENIETWSRRYRYGTSLYQTAVSDIRKSEESVRQAKEGFKQGVRTVSEQLDAQLDLFRSRASKVNAQLSTSTALIQLELTLGRKLNHDDLN